MHHPPLPPKGNISVIHFCYRLSRTDSHIDAGRTMPMKISSDVIGKRNHKLPACVALPQISALLCD